MPRRPIYMDHHATTPTDPRVVEAMEPFGNPSSRHHAFGWAARDAVEQARKQVSRLVGCDPREVSLPVEQPRVEQPRDQRVPDGRGSACPHRDCGNRVPRAVLDPCRRLEREGVKVTYVQPGDDGLVDVEAVEQALTTDTVLMTVMTANNEIGVLQPVVELGALARRRGVLFHTDATQAVGKVPFDAAELDFDLVSLSAHKCYGPKGVGALSVRRRRPKIAITPLIDGGGYERSLRSGTLNVPAIVGFGRAAEICCREMAADAQRTRALMDRLWHGLSDGLDGLRINGSMDRRLPHNLNVSVSGLDGETLLVGLDDVAVSSGAACTSANPEPSHVLSALGVSDQLARASIRFGLGRWNTPDEVDYVVEKSESWWCGCGRCHRVDDSLAPTLGLIRYTDREDG